MKTLIERLTKEQQDRLHGILGEGLWDHITGENGVPEAAKQLIVERMRLAGFSVPEAGQAPVKAVSMKTIRRDRPLLAFYEDQIDNEE